MSRLQTWIHQTIFRCMSSLLMKDGVLSASTREETTAQIGENRKISRQHNKPGHKHQRHN